MDAAFHTVIPLLAGWALDTLAGDPERLPHPVVGFGRWIALGERKLNRPGRKGNTVRGAAFALLSVPGAYGLTAGADRVLTDWNVYAALAFETILVFYCLSGRTLIREVTAVFEAVKRGTGEGRRQLSRIVGRDTAHLSDRQVRTAALETLSENLSDGVVAPVFWYVLLGAPGMLAYKMVNTLDSMIGYKCERYRTFGRWAARLDDAANYIPARLTALLMLTVGAGLKRAGFVRTYGKRHASPNSGYPEAALAALLDCRFGGPNRYFGQTVDKPYIGRTDRDLTDRDLGVAVAVNERTEVVMMVLSSLILLWL